MQFLLGCTALTAQPTSFLYVLGNPEFVACLNPLLGKQTVAVLKQITDTLGDGVDGQSKRKKKKTHRIKDDKELHMSVQR